MGTRTKLSLAAAMVAAASSTALAGDEEIALLDMQVQVGGITSWQDTVGGDLQENGGFYWGDQVYDDPFGAWGIEYSVGLNYAPDGDPPLPGPMSMQSVFSTFGLTNNTGGTETFTVVVSLPMLEALSSITVEGDVEGTLTDADFDGSALLTNTGSGPIYSGLLDGSTALTLMDDPFSQGAAFSTESFGPFVGSGPGPAMAMTSIGLIIEFDLSDGDSASFTANFKATGIPAPAALALFGLAGITRRRRRG